MNVLHAIGCLFVALATVAVSGCAAAYHAYADGCVPYEYCPPAPLPYACYQACPTPVAACHRTAVPAPVVQPAADMPLPTETSPR